MDIANECAIAFEDGKGSAELEHFSNADIIAHLEQEVYNGWLSTSEENDIVDMAAQFADNRLKPENLNDEMKLEEAIEIYKKYSLEDLRLIVKYGKRMLELVDSIYF